jgi:hypothetical protein
MAHVLGCYPMQVPASTSAEFNMNMRQTATITGHGFSLTAFAALSIIRCLN